MCNVKKKGKGKRIAKRIIAVIAVCAGLFMAAYPLIASYVNSKSAASEVTAYDEGVAELTTEEIIDLETAAEEYNAALAYNVSVYGTQDNMNDAFSSGDSGDEEYNSLLNFDGTGIMGYIEIPSIGVYYPIYHGTSDAVLNAGIGHLSGSSLPIGGENTHAVLTGHTGITTNRLFTDIDELEEGDMFYIHILNRTLAYEVVQIQVCLPDNVEPLYIQEGRDLVTLVTCTPYGVNSHRLYVTGERVEYTKTAYETAAAEYDAVSSMLSDEYVQALISGILLGAGVIITLASIRALYIEGKKGKGRGVRVFFGLMLTALGIGMYIYPYVAEYSLNLHTGSEITEFEETFGTEDAYEKAVETGSTLDEILGTDELYQACLDYNTSIFASLQEGLSSIVSYEKSQVKLSVYDGFDEDSAFGYIEIPAMDVTLPLYLGATTDHMALGAAVMGQTSVPIGGENTNSVIVGHRGYRGSPYFREIEQLSIGDYVYITNPWGTLAYKVVSTDIISPHDSESIKIQEGKDMITLLTCHPYRSNGKYRWIVFCERDTDEEARLAAGGEKSDTVEDSSNVVTETVTASDGTVYPTSTSDIERENMLRQFAGAAIVTVVLVSAITSGIRGHRKKKARRKAKLDAQKEAEENP